MQDNNRQTCPPITAGFYRSELPAKQCQAGLLAENPTYCGRYRVCCSLQTRVERKEWKRRGRLSTIPSGLQGGSSVAVPKFGGGIGVVRVVSLRSLTELNGKSGMKRGDIRASHDVGTVV